MRSAWLGALALQASAVLASPTPQTTSQVAGNGFDQLAAIAQSAFDKTKSEVDNGEIQKRDGSCDWDNVRIRREWCVLSQLPMPRSFLRNLSRTVCCGYMS